MSKEFQIRDGNLIASFDLENEDGDIDFCKLLKVSHGVADEIGMFVDYVATNKIIKDQSKKIADLETKLAESEKKNFELVSKLNLKEHKPAFCTLADRDCEALGQVAELKQKLAEKDEEIKQLNNRILFSQLQAPNEQILNILGSQCVQYNPDQDKISFAIDELEKVKETTECILDNALKISSLNQSYYDRLLDEIDNQIKQLREMSNEK